VVARLGPGSPAPASPAEVEALLRLVPVIAFQPELEALVPAPLDAGPLTPHAVLAHADAEWLARVVEALRSLEARALAQDDGGLRFLAVTLGHFLGEGHHQRLPPAEHPLVVALFARTDARRRGAPDHPSEVARLLDGW
jgi:hypothetical protein